MTDNFSFNLSCVGFNCWGFKSSHDSIDKLCKLYDICFICEHWLSLEEVVIAKQQLNDSNKWCHLKSSMDPAEIIAGRPYGGGRLYM